MSQVKSANFSQNKGKRAERAAYHLLQPIVDKVYQEAGFSEADTPHLERNQNQSWKGGHDIIGLDWLALEIKHHETLHINQWWTQTKNQALKAKGEPVLLYKQNNVPFRVRMFGYLPAGSTRIRCPVDISIESFILYLEHRLKQEITKHDHT